MGTSLYQPEAKPRSHWLPGLWHTGKARGPRGSPLEQDAWWDSRAVCCGSRWPSWHRFGWWLCWVSQAYGSTQKPRKEGAAWVTRTRSLTVFTAFDLFAFLGLCTCPEAPLCLASRLGWLTGKLSHGPRDRGTVPGRLAWGGTLWPWAQGGDNPGQTWLSGCPGALVVGGAVWSRDRAFPSRGACGLSEWTVVG